MICNVFFFSSRRRHTRCGRDWSSDVCSSDLSLSVLIAIIFTPSLCATILKATPHDKAQRGPLGWFNRTLEKGTKRYTESVQNIIKRSARFVVIYLGLILVLGFLFVRMLSSFIPNEVRGVILT